MAYETITCSYCDKNIWEGEFIGSYPNGFEIFVKKILIEHYDTCNNYEKESICCPDCGAVLADEISPSYIHNNPNGYEMWEAQLLAQHKSECPVWLKENGADEVIYESVLEFLNGNKKPFKLVQKYYAHNDSVIPYVDVIFGKGGTGLAEKAKTSWVGLDALVEEWNAAIWQLFQDEEFMTIYEDGFESDIMKGFYYGFMYEAFWLEVNRDGLNVDVNTHLYKIQNLVDYERVYIPGVGDRFWMAANPGRLKDYIEEEADRQEDEDEIVEEA